MGRDCDHKWKLIAASLWECSECNGATNTNPFVDYEAEIDRLQKGLAHMTQAFAESADREEKLVERLAEKDRLIAELANDSRLFVPGLWECTQCVFALTRTTIDVESGGMGTTAADREEPELCPNDGSQMVRISWEKHARVMTERAGDEIRRMRALVEFKPTPKSINALPQGIRQYVVMQTLELEKWQKK